MEEPSERFVHEQEIRTQATWLSGSGPGYGQFPHVLDAGSFVRHLLPSEC